LKSFFCDHNSYYCLGIEEFYGEFRKERIAILNTLAAYYTQQAAKTKEKSKREDWLSQATQNYNRADKIDILEEMTWVGKGMLRYHLSSSQFLY
jgi:hypothetical protein